MQIDDTLKEAINLIHDDENGHYWAGQFVDIPVQVKIARLHDHNLQQILQAMQNIYQDIWNVGTLIQRLEWLRDLAIQNQLNTTLWRMFTSLDIEHFHIELRSILDYVANILGIIAKEPGQVRSKSFESLSNWLKKNTSNSNKLGKEESDLVVSASWYSELP